MASLVLLLCGLSGHVLYPFVYYDYLCVASILLSVYFSIKLWSNKAVHLSYYLMGGILATIPFFLKQNYGLFYFVAYHFFWFFVLISKRKYAKLAVNMTGSLFSAALFALYLAINGTVSSFIYQAFLFPAVSKNVVAILMGVAKGFFDPEIVIFIVPLILLGIFNVYFSIDLKIKTIISMIVLIVFGGMIPYVMQVDYNSAI